MKKYEKIEKIIKIIARKYSSYLLNYDDLVQELWVFALGKDNLEENPESLIYTVCKNGAIDIYREQLKIHQLEIVSESPHESGSGVLIYHFPKVEDSAVIKGLIDLFPRGSRERKYIVLKLYNNGLIEYSDLSKFDQRHATKFIEEPTERDYIRALGYAGPTPPGSWVVRKRVMKKLITKYLEM